MTSETLADALTVLEELNRCLREADLSGLRAVQEPLARTARNLEALRLTDEQGFRELAFKVDAVNRQNAMLAHCCLDVLGHGLATICPPPVRYGPRGQAIPRSESHLVEARG